MEDGPLNSRAARAWMRCPLTERFVPQRAAMQTPAILGKGSRIVESKVRASVTTRSGNFGSCANSERAEADVYFAYPVDMGGCS